MQILFNTKAPYNISAPTAELALRALSPASIEIMKSKVSTIVSSRSSLIQAIEALAPLGVGKSIGGQSANFILIPILEKNSSANEKPDNQRAHNVYKRMAESEGVVVRYRGSEIGCEGCLRITVGTEEENKAVVEKLRKTLEEF